MAQVIAKSLSGLLFAIRISLPPVPSRLQLSLQYHEASPVTTIALQFVESAIAAIVRMMLATKDAIVFMFYSFRLRSCKINSQLEKIHNRYSL
jgi:hypothetical protein